MEARLTGAGGTGYSFPGVLVEYTLSANVQGTNVQGTNVQGSKRNG